VFSFFLDGSALAKRYTPEPGSALVDHLFASVSLSRLYALNVGVAEVVSVIVRKRNDGRMAVASAAQALANFGPEVLFSATFNKVELPNSLMLGAISFIDAHSINSTDAIVLRAALDLADRLRQSGDDLALVASDTRLLKAAGAEGLTTFNPEAQTQQELDTLIGP
jgi:predicted nucleic acid-binding protein